MVAFKAEMAVRFSKGRPRAQMHKQDLTIATSKTLLSEIYEELLDKDLATLKH